MIEQPKNVTLIDRALSWDAVEGADGYNVHIGESYHETVFETFYEYPSAPRDIASVSAFKRAYHTPRSLANQTPDIDLSDDFTPAGDVVFQDDFKTLNPDNWNTAYPWGRFQVINGEHQTYLDELGLDRDLNLASVFQTGDNGLTIQARRESFRGQSWVSGKLCTHRKHELWGDFYCEAELRSDFHKGLWPAFWLLNAYYGGDEPEIDVFEQPGFNPQEVYHTYHFLEANVRRYPQIQHISNTDSREWHVYGAERRNGTITFFVDREPVKVITENVTDQPMAILLNLAICGTWAGSPDDSLMAGSLNVRRVTAWQ